MKEENKHAVWHVLGLGGDDDYFFSVGVFFDRAPGVVVAGFLVFEPVSEFAGGFLEDPLGVWMVVGDVPGFEEGELDVCEPVFSDGDKELVGATDLGVLDGGVCEDGHEAGADAAAWVDPGFEGVTDAFFGCSWVRGGGFEDAAGEAPGWDEAVHEFLLCNERADFI